VIIGVPKESYPGERRVALVPMVIPNLVKAGFEVLVETGAGAEAGYPDGLYVEKGAQVLPDRRAVFGRADIVVQVLCYGSNDVTGQADLLLLRREQVLVGFLRPLGSVDVIQRIAQTGVISFAEELMPRTTRAQSMDALSSMGTICDRQPKNRCKAWVGGSWNSRLKQETPRMRTDMVPHRMRASMHGSVNFSVA